MRSGAAGGTRRCMVQDDSVHDDEVDVSIPGAKKGRK